MSVTLEGISSLVAHIPRPALARMIRLVRTLHHLASLPAYRDHLRTELPETARFNPGHDSVMMGYDFHLTDDDARLIEVNTNAGGGLLACLAWAPSHQLNATDLPHRLKAQILRSFSAEIGGFSAGKLMRPGFIAILDEQPRQQFLYPEMEAFSHLFHEWGCRTEIVAPEDLVAGREGVFFDGQRVDLIYNRHCDFYLETEAMKGLRQAYLEKQVCLTPNPFTYGLLADKRRMTLWSTPAFLKEVGLPEKDCRLLQEMIPVSRLLSNMSPEDVWERRKGLVFKPVSRFGSRGVYVGNKISRSKFNDLVPDDTLVQDLVKPSVTPQPDGPGLKTDFRLYVYRHHILGVAARLYQGQVTNLRTAGGGFAAVTTSPLRSSSHLI